jgi:hypothetical protein
MTLTSTDEMILVSKDEYHKLLDAAHFLNCLRNAGVDNWNGYGYAQEAYNEDDNWEEE